MEGGEGENEDRDMDGKWRNVVERKQRSDIENDVKMMCYFLLGGKILLVL